MFARIYPCWFLQRKAPDRTVHLSFAHPPFWRKDKLSLSTPPIVRRGRYLGGQFVAPSCNGREPVNTAPFLDNSRLYHADCEVDVGNRQVFVQVLGLADNK